MLTLSFYKLSGVSGSVGFAVSPPFPSPSPVPVSGPGLGFGFGLGLGFTSGSPVSGFVPSPFPSPLPSGLGLTSVSLYVPVTIKSDVTLEKSISQTISYPSFKGMLLGIIAAFPSSTSTTYDIYIK